MPEDSAAGMRQLLNLKQPPTAVFAASDYLAFAVIGVLRERGRRIPEDVAVIGFDDLQLPRVLAPALTTVRIPFAELGRKAAELALRVSQGYSGDPIAETVQLELMHRSTA